MVAGGIVVPISRWFNAGFNESHTAQMLGYLNITGLEVALLLNFKEAKLTWKRLVTGTDT